MPFSITMKDKTLNWNTEELTKKLEGLSGANKKTWIREDLSISPSSLIGRIFWFVIAKHFAPLRRLFFRVDLDRTQQILNALKPQIQSAQDQKVTALFNKAVGNYNSLVKHHHVAQIVDQPKAPTLQETPIKPIESIDETNKAITPQEVVSKAIEHIGEAQKAPHLDKKREYYNKAFDVLRTHAIANNGLYFPQLKPTLFRLFELYATKTCYAQGSKEKDSQGNSLDSEEGFRKSAALMELSLCYQLDSVGLGITHIDWYQFENLETLIQSLEVQKGQTGKLFPAISNLKIDHNYLLQQSAEKKIQDILKDTLVRLTFSIQNIAMIRKPEYFPVHQSLNDLTEALIGNASIPQKRELAMYKYNRCSFLAGMKKPGDWKAGLESYEPVKQLLIESYPGEPNHPELLSRLAQIANIKGCITVNSKTEKCMDLAYPLFEEAFEIRKKLVGIYEKDSEQQTEQEFLLSNIRTSLIAGLVKRNPITPEDFALIQEHADALKAFIKKTQANGDFHCYHSSYIHAIELAVAAKAKK